MWETFLFDAVDQNCGRFVGGVLEDELAGDLNALGTCEKNLAERKAQPERAGSE